MEKIPTVFKRDPADMSRLLPEVHPDCQWVLDGEGTPTRKYDGTCVMFDGTAWWARREVKPGKQPPDNIQVVMTDANTGKTIGWEPAAQSSFHKWLLEAIGDEPLDNIRIGTYELCGPKVNGNPERFKVHTLRLHSAAQPLVIRPHERTFEGLRHVVVRLLETHDIEGIVWHHPDGRMAKLKARDFAHDRASA